MGVRILLHKIWQLCYNFTMEDCLKAAGEKVIL